MKCSMHCILGKPLIHFFDKADSTYYTIGKLSQLSDIGMKVFMPLIVSAIYILIFKGVQKNDLKMKHALSKEALSKRFKKNTITLKGGFHKPCGLQKWLIKI